MEFCAIVEQSILKSLPDTQVVRIPIADGGEGMVDAYLQSNGGDKVSLEVTGPNFAKVCASYGILPDQTTAVIEMAVSYTHLS